MYKAIVTQTESMRQDIYIGMTENPFKTRYNLHNSSFRLPHKRSTTTLSEHLWTLIVQSLSVENVSNRYTPDKSTKFGMGVP